MYESMIQNEKLKHALDAGLDGFENLEKVVNAVLTMITDSLPDSLDEIDSCKKLLQEINCISGEFADFSNEIIKDSEIRVWYAE